VRYPRKRCGLVYQRRSFACRPPRAENVDFWACDALALPLVAGTFGLVVALNLLDCVAAPRDLLAGLAAALLPGGKAILASPYDWSMAATPVEAWLGGHSQRGPAAGASEPVLRALLTPGGHPAAVDGLVLEAEESGLPWQVRLHDRGTMGYRSHLVVARKTPGKE
jgi:SAM-dependent methyltransferase